MLVAESLHFQVQPGTFRVGRGGWSRFQCGLARQPATRIVVFFVLGERHARACGKAGYGRHVPL